MALENMRGRKILPGQLAVVVGAGKSGLAATRLLIREKARVRLLDSRPDALDAATKKEFLAARVDLKLGPHKAEYFENASYVIPSPGMPVASLAQYLGDKAFDGSGPEIVAEMELAWRYLDTEPVLAVTGTSGKTTTVSLAAAMLQAQGYTVFLGGNIGTPLSEYILSGRKADALVLEISSFQLQACSTFCPRVSVLLNISPNHLDYHKDMQEYIDAKFRLFRCQDEGDLAVIGQPLQKLTEGYGIKARKVWVGDDNRRFPNMQLLGKHNRFNAEAAWQACRFFGVSESAAARAVANFRPLPHRLEKVREHRGVLYVNDSKCTTVSAMEVALRAFEQPVLLLCGGKFKGGDLAALAPLIQEKVKAVAGFGASREHFEPAWQDIVPMTWHDTMQGAVQTLSMQAQKGDVVLLAPATASFDLYKSYKARGEDFRSIVGALS